MKRRGWVSRTTTPATGSPASAGWRSDPTGAIPWGTAQPDQPDAQNCGRMRMTDGIDNENCANQYTFVCECDAYPDLGT